MTAIDRTAYPQFKTSWTEQEVMSLYTLADEERIFVKQYAGSHWQRLLLAISLKSFQHLGYLPRLNQVPPQVKEYVALQLNLSPHRNVLDLRSATRKRYRKLIRDYLGIRAYGIGGATSIKPIIQEAAQIMSDPADLINVAIEELIRQSFELPAYTTLDRYVNHLRHQVHLQMYGLVLKRLSKAQKEVLDALLIREPTETRYPFIKLKALPGRASLKEIRRWEKHLTWLEGLLETDTVLTGLSSTKIEQFASEAIQLETGDMLDIQIPGRQYTLLVCLVHHMQVRVRDQLTEMYLKRVRLLHNNGKKQLKELQDKYRPLNEMMIDAFTQIVYQAEATDLTSDKKQAEKDALLGQQVRQLLLARGGIEKLKEECMFLQAYHDNNYLPLMQKPYRQNRSLPFRVTDQLDIQPTTQNSAVLQALDFIQEHQHKRGPHLPPDVSIDFASTRWQSLIREKADGEEVFNRHQLEMCVFTYVAEHLRSGDLYVAGSEAFADYRTQLLPWEECQAILDSYCGVVGLPTTAAEFVDKLRTQLTKLAQEVDEAQAGDSGLYFDESGKPHLNKLPGQTISEDDLKLEKVLHDRMPERHLLDILHNVHHWAEYTRHFGPPSGADPKLQDPIIYYLLTIFGYGCNLGPAQTARHNRHLVSERILGRLNAQHITTEKLNAAIVDVINQYARFSLPFAWGTGKSSIADGTQYPLYENNLLGERHIRYGGYGGIAHHHISDTYVALFSHFIACGVWEAVYLLDGILQNKSVLQPDTVHADTQGQSEVVFGLAHLLGIELLPRMRNWNKVAMYRPDASATYQHIDGWFTRIANWKLIEEHWQDLMQVVLSIHKGKVLPSWLLQKLTTNSPKNTLYHAFAELGRVIRTIFILKYVSQPALRFGIRAAMTKIEAFQDFSGWVFFGGDKIIRSRDPLEYEKRIKYKDLVANAIMLHNVADMTDVLHDMMQEGYAVTPDFVGTLSPYLTEHIKRFGEYFIELDNVPPPLQPDKRFLSIEMA